MNKEFKVLVQSKKKLKVDEYFGEVEILITGMINKFKMCVKVETFTYANYNRIKIDQLSTSKCYFGMLYKELVEKHQTKPVHKIAANIIIDRMIEEQILTDVKTIRSFNIVNLKQKEQYIN